MKYYLNKTRFEALLLQHGLTVRELAGRSRFHVQRLYRARWGEPVSRDTLARLAYQLRVDVNHLVRKHPRHVPFQEPEVHLEG